MAHKSSLCGGLAEDNCIVITGNILVTEATKQLKSDFCYFHRSYQPATKESTLWKTTAANVCLRDSQLIPCTLGTRVLKKGKEALVPRVYLVLSSLKWFLRDTLIDDHS